jgi:GAG-pre-integrase domain
VSTLQSLDKTSFWYDTMATHHVVFNEQLLSNRSPSGLSAVVLGGNERHQVSCQGDLRVEGGPNGPVVLTGVICAPTLLINLCSGPQFTNKGGECWQGGDKCKLTKQGRTLLEGKKIGIMYKLSCTLQLPGAGAPESYVHTTSALWHRRLGHPGSQVVSQLLKADTVQGLEKVELSAEEHACTTCMGAHACEADS